MEKGRKYCLRLLSVRARSSREITERLREKDHTEQEIKKLREGLEREGLINDARFAVDWVERRLRTSPRGRAVIKRELLEKGISPEMIESAMDDVYEGRCDRDIAEEIARKKIKSISGNKKQNIHAGIFRFLMSKGFDIEIVEEVIERLLPDLE